MVSFVEPNDAEIGEVDSGSKPKLSVKMSVVGADDPFYPREGKTLTWTNVNMVVRGGKKKGDKKVLQNVWGEVPKKEITAVMGPSGSSSTIVSFT